MFRCPLRFGVVVFLFSLLGACGGSGSDSLAVNQSGSGGSEGNSATLTISAFAPSIASLGTEITITGTGLSAVTGAKVGSLAANFVVDSATKLRIIVPAGAATGHIEVTAGGASALSNSELVIASVPQVSSVSPSAMLAPARVTVLGRSLDAVRVARLNGTTLTIASQSASSLELDVPAGAGTGYLTLIDSFGTLRQTAFIITVASPITIAGFAPTSVAHGASLTINGTFLDRAISVQFAGGASAAVAARSGTTSITVIVPADATSGPFTVLGDLNDSVVSTESVTVVVPIVVNANASYAVPNAPDSVTIVGSGLASVTAVTIGTSAAVITAKSDTALTFTVPAGVQCGPITLLSGTQPAVPAGTLTVGSGCTVRSAGIEFAQVLSQTTFDSYQRLVPRKSTLVRAYVVSGVAGSPAPTVRLTGQRGTTALGSVTMTGPSTLPQLSSGAPVPSTLRYSETQTFNAALPSTWIDVGLIVRVDIDPERRFGNTVSVNATPAVGSSTRIDLVMVPLVSGGHVPQLPDVTSLVDELVRRFPMSREAIAVSVRAPYSVSTTSDGIDTSAEWSGVLSELDQLRRQEAPSKHYFGFSKPMVANGTAGIGYINSVGSFSPFLTAVGWDASRANWRRTMVHEIGHNFSRRHAPCGTSSGIDARYPYASGTLSDTPLYESLLNDILSPVNQNDVMGYCNGIWFSDYNLREVQRFMEARPQGGFSAVATGANVSGEVIVLSGRIDVGGVSLDPVQRARGTQSAAAISSEYRLRLHTNAGNVVEVPIDATEVDHVDEKHFYAAAPSPGKLVRVEVMHRGVALPLRGGRHVRAQAASTPVASGPSVQWREVGTALELTWDNTVSATASVTHVGAEDRRTVLTLNLRGGSARVDVSTLPRGGEYEISLSNGLDAQLIVVRR